MVVFVESSSLKKLRDQAEDGPSPELIEARTAEIRARWSPRVRRRRRIDGCPETSVTRMPLVPRRKGSWGE